MDFSAIYHPKVATWVKYVVAQRSGRGRFQPGGEGWPGHLAAENVESRRPNFGRLFLVLFLGVLLGENVSNIRGRDISNIFPTNPTPRGGGVVRGGGDVFCESWDAPVPQRDDPGFSTALVSDRVV